MTRRERFRDELTAEIKAAGRSLLGSRSDADLSLRAVAREVDITPSGIYRYFESRGALVSAIATDGYRSAAASVAQAGEMSASSAERLHAMALAYRQWAITHAPEFSVMFATDLSEQGEPSERAAVAEFFRAPMTVFLEGVRRGELAPGPGLVDSPDDLTEAASALAAELDHRVRPAELGVLFSGWVSLHGYVVLELSGMTSGLLHHPEEAYATHARVVLRSLGARCAD